MCFFFIFAKNDEIDGLYLSLKITCLGKKVFGTEKLSKLPKFGEKFDFMNLGENLVH